jgi:hypothetical protein
MIPGNDKRRCSAMSEGGELQKYICLEYESEVAHQPLRTFCRLSSALIHSLLVCRYAAYNGVSLVTACQI